MGEITKKVQERRIKRYEYVMRREKHYVGRREMEMKVQGKRKRIWLNKVKDDIKEKGLFGRNGLSRESMTVLHGGVWHRTSTPHQSGNKMKEKKKRHVARK